jgi:DMSO reductase family type II enzyme heme b subunit
MRVDEKIDSDIALAYANRVTDSNVETYPQLMNDIAYLSGRDVGNINSETAKVSPVENVMAIGPQTVTSFPETQQKVMGKGIWDGQKWQVVFVRKLKFDSKQKVNFIKGESIPIAFAIWNGSEKDRNGQKMVSTWYDLELKD